MKITFPPAPGRPEPPPGKETYSKLSEVPIGEPFFLKEEYFIRLNQKLGDGTIVCARLNGEICYHQGGIVVRRCKGEISISWA
jgi:hypothetical protein